MPDLQPVKAKVSKCPAGHGAICPRRDSLTTERRQDPVGDLGMTELKIDVAKGYVPEQVFAISVPNSPAGVTLSAPSLVPSLDPGDCLFLRIEPSHVPLLDAWLVKRLHHACSVCPRPVSQPDRALCPQHGLFSVGHAASRDTGGTRRGTRGIMPSGGDVRAARLNR
jgi:hypothetical protein